MTGGSDLDTETIGELFSRLLEDGRNLVRAETNLQVQSLLERFRELRTALILGVVALFLLQSSLVGLLVGLVLGLAKWVGPVGAGAIVTLSMFILIALLLWLAARQFANVSKARSTRR